MLIDSNWTIQFNKWSPEFRLSVKHKALGRWGSSGAHIPEEGKDSNHLLSVLSRGKLGLWDKHVHGLSHRVLKEGCPDKVTFELRPKESESKSWKYPGEEHSQKRKELVQSHPRGIVLCPFEEPQGESRGLGWVPKKESRWSNRNGTCHAGKAMGHSKNIRVYSKCRRHWGALNRRTWTQFIFERLGPAIELHK